MSATPSWHTSAFPELRAGPPWVMEEMILSQAALPEPLLSRSREVATRIAAAIAQAARVGEPIVVTGCGTSEHGALAIAELISERLFDAGTNGRAEPRQALDAALSPRRGGVCIGVSHNGGTRATNLALEAARGAGATTVAVTAHPEAAVAAATDYVLSTPAFDRSWCHTVAYTSAILAGGAIAGEDDAVALADTIARTLSLRGELEALVAELPRSGRIVSSGLGADHVAARELALKLEEGARIPATAFQLESLLHGHLAGCDADSTALVLLAVDPRHRERRDRRLGLAAQAAAAIGIPTIVLTGPEAHPALPETAGRLDVPLSDPGSLLHAFVGSAIAVQLLTLGLVHVAGANPDLIRRELDAYREAAELADGTPDW